MALASGDKGGVLICIRLSSPPCYLDINRVQFNAKHQHPQQRTHTMNARKIHDAHDDNCTLIILGVVMLATAIYLWFVI